MRPKLAAHIALVSNIWNIYEVKLAMTMMHLIGTDFQTAWLVLFTAPNFNQRASLARRLVKHRLDATKFSLFKEHLDKAEKVARRRNEIIHGVWGISDRYHDGIVRQNPQDVFLGGQMWLFEESDFVDIEEQVNSLIAAMEDFERSNLPWRLVAEPTQDEQ